MLPSSTMHTAHFCRTDYGNLISKEDHDENRKNTLYVRKYVKCTVYIMQKNKRKKTKARKCGRLKPDRQREDIL